MWDELWLELLSWTGTICSPCLTFQTAFFGKENELVGWLGAAGRMCGTESAAVLEATAVITYLLIRMLNSKRNVQPRPLGQGQGMFCGSEYLIQKLAQTILPHASSTGWLNTMQQIEQESWVISGFDLYCGVLSSAGKNDSGAVSSMCFKINLAVSPEYLPPCLSFRFCPPPFATRSKFWHTYGHCMS